MEKGQFGGRVSWWRRWAGVDEGVEVGGEGTVRLFLSEKEVGRKRN